MEIKKGVFFMKTFMKIMSITLPVLLVWLSSLSCQPHYQKEQKVTWSKIELASMEWSVRTRRRMDFKSVWNDSEVYRDTVADYSFLSVLQDHLQKLTRVTGERSHDVRIACLLYNGKTMVDTLTISWFTIQLNQEYYEFDEGLLQHFAERLPPYQQEDIQRSLEISRELKEEEEREKGK